MQFFTSYFKLEGKEPNDAGEYQVCCPFPHTDEKGNAYMESNPSAHVNEEGIFHCKVCGTGLSEAGLMVKTQGISYRDALNLLNRMNTRVTATWTKFEDLFWESAVACDRWQKLGFPLSLAKDLRIGYKNVGFSVPVFMFGELMDVRTYNPDGKPKITSEKGAKNLIVPYDLWQQDERPTLLCAGEKDMIMARTHGFNAITFTGGERSFPKLFKHSFKGKKVYIIYDNDQAGKDGAQEVAVKLTDAGAIPYVVTGHYEYCTQKGEDLFDFFHKYEQQADSLQRILTCTDPFDEASYQKVRQRFIPNIKLEQAGRGEYTGKDVSALVNITSVFEDEYVIPEYVRLWKTDQKKGDLYSEGDSWEWMLDETNMKDILNMFDNNVNEDKLRTFLKRAVGIPAKEGFISMAIMSRTHIHKVIVSDAISSTTQSELEDDVSTKEIMMYSIDKRLRAGRNYFITFRPYPHPLQAQKLVGIIHDTVEQDHHTSNFDVTPDVLESLKRFQPLPGESVSSKMNELFERSKSFIGVEARREIMYFTELYFHTPLQFQFGSRVERAYLDLMLIGDERTMKSATAKAMQNLYEVGVVASLKTVTEQALVGGSDNSQGGWRIKLGMIPRNHKGALIMEEFSGGGKGIVSRLTEVRSSNRVRIGRVSGQIDVPAMVRMLSISNPASGSDGENKSIGQYPQGIKVIQELVGAKEDIARYDLFLLVKASEQYISPLDMYGMDAFDKQDYLNRVRWAWSRKPENVQLSRQTMEYIVMHQNKLNEEFDMQVKIFGPETWKKIARLAIATACALGSCDDSGQNVVVLNEHIDWAVQFMRDCYDNDTFRLRPYVELQRRYNQSDAHAVQALQEIYSKNATMLIQMEQNSELTQRQLQAVSGLEPKEFSQVLNRMAAGYFFEWVGDRIVPSKRFRTAMNSVNRNQTMPRVGEMR